LTSLLKRTDLLRALVKGLHRSRLVCAYATYCHIRDEEVFADGGAARETAEHGELADVGKRVGNRTLHKPVDGGLEGCVGGKKVIEAFDGAKESGLLFSPRARLCGVPFLVSERDTERPVKEVAHVSEDLDGCAADSGEAGEVVRGSIKGACSAIGESSDGVAKELAGGVGG